MAASDGVSPHLGIYPPGPKRRRRLARCGFRCGAPSQPHPFGFQDPDHSSRRPRRTQRGPLSWTLILRWSVLDAGTINDRAGRAQTDSLARRKEAMREFDGSARQTTEHVSELSSVSPAYVRGRLRLKLFCPRRQYTSSRAKQLSTSPLHICAISLACALGRLR